MIKILNKCDNFRNVKILFKQTDKIMLGYRKFYNNDLRLPILNFIYFGYSFIYN